MFISFANKKQKKKKLLTAIPSMTTCAIAIIVEGAGLSQQWSEGTSLSTEDSSQILLKHVLGFNILNLKDMLFFTAKFPGRLLVNDLLIMKKWIQVN